MLLLRPLCKVVKIGRRRRRLRRPLQIRGDGFGGGDLDVRLEIAPRVRVRVVVVIGGGGFGRTLQIGFSGGGGDVQRRGTVHHGGDVQRRGTVHRGVVGGDAVDDIFLNGGGHGSAQVHGEVEGNIPFLLRRRVHVWDVPYHRRLRGRGELLEKRVGV